MGSNPVVVSGARGPGSYRTVDNEGPSSAVVVGINPHEGDVMFVSQYPQLQILLGDYGEPFMNMKSGRMEKPRLWVRFVASEKGGYLRLNAKENPEDEIKIERLRKYRRNGIDYVEQSVAQAAAKKASQEHYLAMVDSDPELRAALEVRLNAKALPLPPRDSEARVGRPKKGTDTE